VLVVHGPAVNNGAGGIEDEDFGGAGGFEGGGEGEVLIVNHGAFEAMLFHGGADVLRLVACGGIHVKEGGILREFLFHGGEGGEQFGAQRTGGAGEGDHEGFVFSSEAAEG